MKRALAVSLCILAACSHAPDQAVIDASAGGAGGAMWGTDAHLAASPPDAIMRYVDHPRGFAELRLPRGAGPFPLAVIFHGGCFKFGVADHAYMGPLATSWQENGIATLNVDYRETGDGGGWTGSFDDWLAAANLIDEVTGTYPIDRARVTLVGHSAGSLPALWLAERHGRDAPGGPRAPVYARAALILDGPGDLGREQAAFDTLCEFSSVAPFMGGLPGEVPTRFGAVSPFNHAPELDRILFVNAAMPVPPDDVLTAMRAGGARTSVLDRSGNSHFSIITPGTAVFDDMQETVLALLRGD